MLLSLANWWHSLFNIMSAFGIYSSPITVVSRCYQQAALRCIWMLMSGLFGTRKWNSLEVRGFILAKDLLTSPLCHAWWCRIPVHPLLGHIRNKAACWQCNNSHPQAPSAFLLHLSSEVSETQFCRETSLSVTITLSRPWSTPTKLSDIWSKHKIPERGREEGPISRQISKLNTSQISMRSF